MIRRVLVLTALMTLVATEAAAQFPPPFDPWFPPISILRLLTVAKSGTGTGVVSAVGGGINCGVNCTHAYNHGVNVVMTAISGGANHQFQGWSGACSGTGACTVLMNQARTVTATFVFAWSLAWNDNSANETNFELERRAPCGTGTFALLSVPITDATTFVDATASPTVGSEYRVRAVNAGGASAYSNTLCATPP